MPLVEKEQLIHLLREAVHDWRQEGGHIVGDGGNSQAIYDTLSRCEDRIQTIIDLAEAL